MSATLAACELDGWEARVEVRAELSFSLLIDDAAVGRARAGPVPVTDPTAPRGGERSDEPDGRTAEPSRPDDPGYGPSAERFGAPAARSSLHVHRSATTAGSAMDQALTDCGPAQRNRRNRRVAPQTAVGPERRLTPTPNRPHREGPPPSRPPPDRAGRRRPTRGRPDRRRRAFSTTSSTRTAPGLVQRVVAVAALGRLHAGRAAGCALAGGDRLPGGARATAASTAWPRSANPAPPGWPS